MTRGHPVLCSLVRGNDKPTGQRDREVRRRRDRKSRLGFYLYGVMTRTPAFFACDFQRLSQRTEVGPRGTRDRVRFGPFVGKLWSGERVRF